MYFNQNLNINKNDIFEQWGPLVEEMMGTENLQDANGRKNQAKHQWLSEYCHWHATSEQYDKAMMNESFTYGTASNMSNTGGMGSVSPGGAPGGVSSFYGSGAAGSGDKFPSLLPLAIQVAARTVGFDVVPVIPMPGPTGVLTYLDYVYAGGKTGTEDKPLLVKVDAADINSVAYVVGTSYWGVNAAPATDNYALGDKSVELIFVGYSRIDGYAIFRVGDTYTSDASSVWTADATVTLTAVFDTTGVIAADIATYPSKLASEATTHRIVCTSKPALVRAIEDHVQGVSGAGTFDNDNWTGPSADGGTPMNPMGRGTGENTYYRMMGITAYTKFVEAETFQVGANVTTEQIQDLQKQFGIDVVSMIENALINEVSQSINKHILSRLFALGWTNNANMLKTEDVTLNMTLDSTQTVAGVTPSFLNKTGFSETMAFTKYQSYGTFENLHTLQRRIMSKLIAAGNIIAQRGRRGPANFCVTNLQIATALQDSAQFTFAPMNNTINQTNGSMYPIGTVAGMTIYVDPNMKFSDNRVLIGRKGEDTEPGVKFMPYLMAESIQTIAEGTMAPKIAVKSRYALVEAGHWPETQYYTMYIDTGDVGII